jgi:type II secretory pathway component PulC
MQKHIYLSVFLGLIFNTLFFAQTEVIVEKEVVVENEEVIDGQTEITIERTVIDEDGNETKYVIKKIGDEANDVLSQEAIKEHIGRDFKLDSKKSGKDENVRIFMIDRDVESMSPRHHAARWVSKEDRDQPKVRMGVELDNVDDGVKITYVNGNTAAHEGGLQAEDIITLLDNQPIATHQELTNVLMSKEAGDKLKVTFIRDGNEQTVTLILRENVNHPDYAGEDHCGYLTKPCLGVRFNSWNDGISITSIFEKSGAEVSGLQAGDMLIKANGEPYKFTRQFDRMIKTQKPGSFLDLEYKRGEEILTTKAEIGVWDECGVCRLLSNEKEEIETIDMQLPLPELTLNAFDMYPVPARDQLTVSFMTENAPIEITFYDANGKMIDRQNMTEFSGSFTKTYDVTDVVKGMALITITQDGKSTTKQALIQ